MNPSYFDQVLGYPEREGLMTQCPALALFCYQEFVAAIQGGKRVVDPLSAKDEVAVLLSAATVSEVTARVFATVEEGATLHPFWRTLRAALESAWDPVQGGDVHWRLYEVAGNARFYGKAMPRMPLAQLSFQNTLDASRSILHMSTACALAGSIDPFGEKRGQPLASMLQYYRLVPTSSETREITSEGLSFCMQPLQQQWWTLVSVALDRILVLTKNSGVTRAELWQLLAVLFALDTSQFVYPFPEKEKDLAAFQILARLSEVGLVYPLISGGRRCFALSPHFHHAVCWSSTAPLCTAALLDSGGNSMGRVRREDEDTIITEANFRLYAYTRNPDLLNILNQFAERDAEVDQMIACYRVTRRTFAAALKRGIGSSHILQFLAVKAHPSMLRHHREGDSKKASGLSVLGAGTRFKNASDIRIDEIIPQSFCDQLMTWEKECRRLIFSRNLVLLRNVTAVQKELLLNALSSGGERHAVVHQEKGYLVVQREAYERVLAPLIPTE
ncbi:putative DNA repair and transcription factor protein [Trypanosoma cruzi]|uniref:General transcription factor IIH subunit 4 n=2 Tax=Trypanosoma cruzi TaxID=5693 RepID=Q4DF86_TRYCC|nr:DNA repair and transcription factor protein, putative [Trypanosoma cruzi]EAN91192.1 DNA repair and transcription factor protein, putative [Trypanosoma cruzi]PWV20155.1 putative DNA repair and transcription factor protein [Trypanosoma cruzi]RNC41921.1 DNA repair and transcription factor protein [Trypanosoma cruzi]|eukprot:XP_813043.1 DNA repair and transcription factor protein [Trypanosoma cruzi strain CL Brener]